MSCAIEAAYFEGASRIVVVRENEVRQMNPIPGPVSQPQGAVTPTCPRCGVSMEATSLQSTLRVGQPIPPALTLAVWRCQTCGIKRPRFV